MNRLGNLGILLAGIGFLLWGLGSAVDSYIILEDYRWEQEMMQNETSIYREDWLGTEELFKMGAQNDSIGMVLYSIRNPGNPCCCHW